MSFLREDILVFHLAIPQFFEGGSAVRWMESKRRGIMITREKSMKRGEANFIREDAYGLVSD